MIEPSTLPRNNYKPLTGKPTVHSNINVLLFFGGNNIRGIQTDKMYFKVTIKKRT